MIIFPGSKVNLGLRITERLENGYHSLESIFLPIPFSDILELIPISKAEPSSFHYSGLKIDGEKSNNLIYKAWELLNKDFNLPPIDVYLHKVVPTGAGLGGGSADASAMLKLLNSQFELNISEHQLKIYAKEIGADCPFFITNKTAYVTGIGDILDPIILPLKGYHFYLISPGIHINTAEAFKHCNVRKRELSLIEIVKTKNIKDWKDYIENDFEDYAFQLHPELKEIKVSLYKKGAIYASMTGTGSSIYGIFDHKPNLEGVLTKYSSFYQAL